MSGFNMRLLTQIALCFERKSMKFCFNVTRWTLGTSQVSTCAGWHLARGCVLTYLSFSAKTTENILYH